MTYVSHMYIQREREREKVNMSIYVDVMSASNQDIKETNIAEASDIVDDNDDVELEEQPIAIAFTNSTSENLDYIHEEFVYEGMFTWYTIVRSLGQDDTTSLTLKNMQYLAAFLAQELSFLAQELTEVILKENIDIIVEYALGRVICRNSQQNLWITKRARERLAIQRQNNKYQKP